MGRSSALVLISPDQDELDQLRHALERSQQKVHHLETALVHSRDIGAAMGVLMAMHKVGRDAAFEMLRTASQNQNRKLSAVALDVIELGCLPTAASQSAR
ncbi:ANTAR domain-containing protein [Terrabacter terrigena]|uniref:ANTAR domain-containing protein n=1 Tax=Terrabacter terrigena TaxID=574718 RepID=A0ABW3MUR8_9MICO